MTAAASLPDSGEDIDLTLRHVSRRFPEDFARALLPPGTPITAATWLDTQVTARQRRLDADRRQRGLRHAILPLLREEIVMNSWVYTQGKEKGLEEGLAKGVKEGRTEAMQRSLSELFVRRLGRAPMPEEEQALARRAGEVKPEQLFELFEMPAEALLAWCLASR